jgi:hypothetical protein
MFKCKMGCGLVVHDPVAHVQQGHPGSQWYPKPILPEGKRDPITGRFASPTWAEWEDYNDAERAYDNWVEDSFDPINFSITNG